MTDTYLRSLPRRRQGPPSADPSFTQGQGTIAEQAAAFGARGRRAHESCRRGAEAQAELDARKQASGAMSKLGAGAPVFLVGCEHECLTILGSRGALRDVRDLCWFFEALAALAPALHGESSLFNGYGRVYIDSGLHLEFASIECDSPYVLPIVVETQQRLVQRAVDCMAAAGRPRLLLANNNHSGLLQPLAPTWGSHENYLVHRHPTSFDPDLLPFLATRVYHGAGGIQWPGAGFLAAVRALFIARDVGGSTTGDRAVLSTCRDEPLASRELGCSRCHLILGDGHRSHFNTALQFGATALALQAIDFDPALGARAKAAAGLAGESSWVAWLRRFNHLADPGQPPRVDPRAIAVQRTYLDGARRWAACVAAPEWVPDLLADWTDTLDALAREDRAWLAARLDAFAKYELFSAVLAAAGRDWQSLCGDAALFSELALIDQSYHAFTEADSVFDALVADGALDHRVGPPVVAGEEAEPFVPAVATRAAARARWLVENAPDRRYSLDWTSVVDLEGRRWRRLDDPFAESFSDWVDLNPPPDPRPTVAERLGEIPF